MPTIGFKETGKVYACGLDWNCYTNRLTGESKVGEAADGRISEATFIRSPLIVA